MFNLCHTHMMMIIFGLVFLGLVLFFSSSKTLNGVLFMTYLMLSLHWVYPMEELSKVLDCYFYLDGLSLPLALLSFYLTILMFYSSFSVKFNKLNFSMFYSLMYLLLILLILSFLVNSLLLFYFFFEASLIPTLLIIMGWGYQPERLQAGVYFMMYTLLASLPLLMVLLVFFKTTGSFGLLNYFNLNSVIMYWFKDGSLLGGLMGIFMLAAFLVKMPMFMIHLWLPKAHLEAPVAGSMILAGVLLKLGGYGICRLYYFGYNLVSWVSGYIIGLSILGMLFIGVSCCRLNDMKALVAYSSVAHMGLVLAGLFSFFVWGWNGGLMMMVSHGLVSSGLFCSVNLFYERLSSRSLYLNKGLLSLSPIFCLLVFLLCCFNISAPPSINLLSEIFLMLSVLGYNSLMVLVFPLGSFMGAVFTFYMFSYSQHGSMFNNLWGVSSYYFNELHLLTFHLAPVIFILLNINPLILLM